MIQILVIWCKLNLTKLVKHDLPRLILSEKPKNVVQINRSFFMFFEQIESKNYQILSFLSIYSANTLF